MQKRSAVQYDHYLCENGDSIMVTIFDDGTKRIDRTEYIWKGGMVVMNPVPCSQVCVPLDAKLVSIKQVDDDE